MKKLLLVIGVLMTAVSCDDTQVGEDEGPLLMGRWLLYERGYSPGSGYIVEPVDPTPAQTLTFRVGGGLTSTIVGLENYTFYHIFDDPNNSGRILALFKQDPGGVPKLASSTTTYNIEREGDTVKLYYRFCIEGCHIALRKTDVVTK